LQQSITFDRGTEFAAYPVLKQRLGIDRYFCQPQAPWHKGGVENLNGRLRRFLPRETDVALLSYDELEAICARLNHAPRKCLGYRTPHVLTAQLDLSDGEP
jgi:IS30 family transposase